MGGAVSTGLNNHELIDNLLHADYIRTALVERVFRAVDRAEYFLPQYRINAYKDLAWKSGNLHLSAPCIYSEVMEGLALERGLSFLNLGSGTGYLSTLVGLTLGINGLNHGVEIHEDVIEYAVRKVEDFKRLSGALDEFDFCEPKFIKGNCLCLSSDTRQYDRIYCGAACPETYLNYMKNLLKMGGILVMPLGDQLLQIKRTDEANWETNPMLPVSFATLVEPVEGRQETVHLVDIQPVSLQMACRSVIRILLRQQIDIEFPNLKVWPKGKKATKKRALMKFVVPIFDTSDDDSDEEDGEVHMRETTRDFGRVHVQRPDNSSPGRTKDLNSIIPFVLGRLRERSGRTQRATPETATTAANAQDECVVEVREAMETCTAQVHESSDVNVQESDSQASENAAEETTDVVEKCNELNETDEEEDEELEKAGSSLDHMDIKKELSKGSKREKFDSGLGDEMVDKDVSLTSDTSDLEDVMEMDSHDSSNESVESRRAKRTSRPQKEKRTGGKWRRITLSNAGEDGTSSDTDSGTDESRFNTTSSRMISSPYSALMKGKIQQLPLPPVLKNYLNFYREF